MGGSAFNRFIRMYLESLTEEELTKAVEEVEADLDRTAHSRGSSPPPRPRSKDSRRQSLEKLWRQPTSGRYVSNYFQQFHQPAIAFFRDKNYDAIQEGLPEATKRFGARSVAFALLVHPDKYRQRIGRAYLGGIEEGAFKKTPDSGRGTIQKSAGEAKAQPGSVTAEAVVDHVSDVIPSAIQQTIDQFRVITGILNREEIPGSADSWLQTFDEELQALIEAWRKYREERLARAQRISDVLQQVAELTPMLQDAAGYCGFVVPAVLLDSGYLLHRTLAELTKIATIIKSCAPEYGNVHVMASSPCSSAVRIRC